MAATVFALVFPAELPDKTSLASLVLGTRYGPRQVFAGVAAAFTVHVALAVVAGSLLVLLPRKWLDLVVGVMFLVGAAALLRGPGDEVVEISAQEAAQVPFVKAAATSFAVILVAEFGDLTQLLIANLAAKYDEPAGVALGAVLALWAAAAVAILGGRSLLRVVPVVLIGRVAGAVMAVFGVISIVAAARA